MEAAVPVWRTQHFLADTDADFAQRLKLSSAFGFFQDISAAHASNLGGDVEWLRDELGVAWILMRMRVEVTKYPRIRDTITVETWPQKPRALYERDYVIYDAEENSLMRAASTWIIMNLKDRSIVREKILDYRGAEMWTKRSLGRSLGKLRPVSGAAPVFEKLIGYSDVDYNGHLNNARHVDFIMDSIPFSEHKKREIRALEINYLNELVPGDTLELRRAADPADEAVSHFEGVRKEDGESVILADIEWADRTE